MWERENLKESARWALRDNGYIRPVLVSAIVLLLTMSEGMRGLVSNVYFQVFGIEQNQYIAEAKRNLPQIAWFWGAVAALGLSWHALIVNPLMVGVKRYFLEHRATKARASLAFRTFREGYWNAVKVLLIRDVIVLAGRCF